VNRSVLQVLAVALTVAAIGVADEVEFLNGSKTKGVALAKAMR
jgi:hypothetical protein